MWRAIYNFIGNTLTSPLTIEEWWDCRNRFPSLAKAYHRGILEGWEVARRYRTLIGASNAEAN